MNKTIAVCDLCLERVDAAGTAAKPDEPTSLAFDLPGGPVHVCSRCEEKREVADLLDVITESLKAHPWQTCRCTACMFPDAQGLASAQASQVDYTKKTR